MDLPELLEVMGRVPEFEATFTSVAGEVSKLADFHVSVAACLAAQALNIPHLAEQKIFNPAMRRRGRSSAVGKAKSTSATTRAWKTSSARSACLSHRVARVRSCGS
ncbi:hypothetical protein ACFV1N_35695 [Streptosporangium canum]|uniref:hypothetical protein n=1 Tax=Streptosporangium canum TaxID=324952 RepID=UPI0036D18B19